MSTSTQTAACCVSPATTGQFTYFPFVRQLRTSSSNTLSPPLLFFQNISPQSGVSLRLRSPGAQGTHSFNPPIDWKILILSFSDVFVPLVKMIPLSQFVQMAATTGRDVSQESKMISAVFSLQICFLRQGRGEERRLRAVSGHCRLTNEGC